MSCCVNNCFEHVRTAEEVQVTLSSAKIKTSNLHQCPQMLYSKIVAIDSKIKLIELDDHLMTTFENGESLFFKGELHGEAVLTSSNYTYELKEAETSNTLVLFSSLKLFKDIHNNNDEKVSEPRHVSGGILLHTYYETSRCQPKLENLLQLLKESSFKGIEYEKQLIKENLYNWEKLNHQIQASDNEIKRILEKNSIVVIDGYYRLISFEYKAQALTMILDVMEENSWELDQIDKEKTYNALKELIPRSIFDIVFHNYAEPSQTGESLYKYNNERVCRFLAEVLLAASPVNEYKQFLDAWRIGVPLKMDPKPEYLNGIAIVKWNNQELRKEVVSFPLLNLPLDINSRFNELFKAKDKWSIEEITPYLLNANGCTDVNLLLTKFARSSVVNGIEYYSSKYNK